MTPPTRATRTRARSKSRGLPKWIGAVATRVGCDPAAALASARNSPASAFKPPYRDFFEALASHAEEDFRSGNKLILLDLLAVFPGILLEPERFPWVLEGLRQFFSDRAYYALAPLTGQRVRRKTPPSRAGLLKPKDIPLWMREFHAPEEENLHVLANKARMQPYVIGEQEYLPFFRTLSGKARQLIAEGKSLAIVELLDVFPHYLHHVDKFPWLPEALFGAFSIEFCELYSALRKRLGRKVPSDEDLVTNAVVKSLLAAVKFEPADHPENDSGHIVPSGLSFQEAIDAVANVKRGKTLTSQEKGRRKKVLKQIERARKKLKDGFDP